MTTENKSNTAQGADLLNQPKTEPKAETPPQVQTPPQGEKPLPAQVVAAQEKKALVPDFKTAKATEIASFFNRYLPNLTQFLDPKMTDFAKRQLGIASQLIADSDGLRNCTPKSIFGCLQKVANSGLDLGLNEVALVPRGGVCTYEIQAQGYRKMAYNTGLVSVMNAHIIYEGEEFSHEIVNGIETIKHKKDLNSWGQKIIGAYAVAVMKDGGFIARVMPLGELERNAKMGAANSPAYAKTPESMYVTKSFKHLCKRLPLRHEDLAALNSDEMPVTPKGTDFTPFEIVE